MYNKSSIFVKKPFLVMVLLFTLTITSYATEITNITTDDTQEEQTQTSITEIIDDANEEPTEINETIEETSAEESTEEQNAEDVIEETTGTNQYPVVTLNFSTEFTFDIEDKSIYVISVFFPTGLVEADGNEKQDHLNLFAEDNFTGTKTLTVYTNDLQMNANVDMDAASLYKIEFEGLEPVSFMGDVFWNTGKISSPQNGNTYDVKLIVSENEGVIKDPNEAPTFSEEAQKILTREPSEPEESESINESDSEIEETTEAQTEPEPDVPEQNSKMGVVTIIVIILIMIILAFAIIRFIKKCRSQDDDD